MIRLPYPVIGHKKDLRHFYAVLKENGLAITEEVSHRFAQVNEEGNKLETLKRALERELERAMTHLFLCPVFSSLIPDQRRNLFLRTTVTGYGISGTYGKLGGVLGFSSGVAAAEILGLVLGYSPPGFLVSAGLYFFLLGGFCGGITDRPNIYGLRLTLAEAHEKADKFLEHLTKSHEQLPYR